MSTNETPAKVETPRTDSKTVLCNYGQVNVPADFARILETELAQAKAEIERLQEFELDITCIGRDVHDYCKDLKADRTRRLPTLVVTMIGNLRARAETAEAELAECRKDRERLIDLLNQMLTVAENCDETGYADGVGFVNIDKLYDEVRAAIAQEGADHD